MRTWIKGVLVVGAVLCVVTLLTGNTKVNWVITAAIIMTFQHAQIADRLQERQAKMAVPDVACYYKLNWLFAIKEILWITAFIMLKTWSAIIGADMFALYPLWRKYYRSKIKPRK